MQCPGTHARTHAVTSGSTLVHRSVQLVKVDVVDPPVYEYIVVAMNSSNVKAAFGWPRLMSL